jgi:hypothetical protein
MLEYSLTEGHKPYQMDMTDGHDERTDMSVDQTPLQPWYRHQLMD